MHIVEGNFKTFRAGSNDIPAGTAVKLSSGVVVAASAAADKILGTVEAKAYKNEQIDVHLRSAAGTINVLAGGTIAEGDAVTADSNGAGVATTTGGNQILGYALEAGVAGAFVELMPSTAKV